MLVKPDDPPPLVVYRATRHSLVGAVAGAEISILGFAISTWYDSELAFILALLIPTLAATGIILLGALWVGRRDSAFPRLERDLKGAARLLKQGLINETDYQRLKSRALEVYHPEGRAMTVREALRIARWGGLVGFNVPLLIHAFNYGWVLSDFAAVLIASLAVGGIVSGITSLALQYFRRWRARRQPPEVIEGR